MSNYFFKDSKLNSIVTWDELISDLKKTRTYNPYCKSDDYYEVFRHIIVSMLLPEEIILLDSDFTDSELENLTGCSRYEQFQQPIKREILDVPNKAELIRRLRNTSDEWKSTLFTSGTTGIPKKITHDFRSIARFVKYSDKVGTNTWGFAYNPTHMAGVQVFLQVLLNGESIVKLFGLSPSEIREEIRENQITHISATPTFYRLLLPSEDSFPTVTRMTSGGEKLDLNTVKQLTKFFPNAKITNVYASTEAGTLFASENEVFTVKPEFENLTKVENDELLIHRSLMGSPDVGSDLAEGDWYKTGDLVEMISKKPLKFRFLSRENDMINVGGYKVNSLEVEDVIREIPGVKNVRVYSKSSSVIGNVICCEVVRGDDQIGEPTIRSYLQSKIQEFKIPRVIRFVDKLSTSRTGKVKRN